MSTPHKKIGELLRDRVAKELRKKLSDSPDVFILNCHRLKSTDLTQLRKDLKAAGSGILVTKNSYIRKAFEGAKKPQAGLDLIDGQTAMVFVKEDPIGVSKVLVEFNKAHEAAAIRGGFLQDRILAQQDIKAIAKLSSRKFLYQQVASTLKAPVGKLAVGLNQILAKLAYALKAVGDKKKVSA